MSMFWRRVVTIWLFVPAQGILWYLCIESTRSNLAMSALFGFLAFVHLVVALDQLKKRGLRIEKNVERQKLIGIFAGIALGKSILQLFSHPERFFDSWFLFLAILPYLLFMGPLTKENSVEEAAI